MAAAEAIRSNITDMLRYLRCNLGSGPLAGDCLYAQQPRDTYTGNRIGLFWYTGDFVPLTRHDGGTGGFAAFIGMSPDRQRGIVILSNVAQPVDQLGDHCLDQALPAPAAPPQTVLLDPSVLAQHVGTYLFDAGTEVTVALITPRPDDGESGLTVQLTGQRAFPLYATVRDHFFLKVVNAQVDFTRDAAGNVVAITNHQGGQDHTGVRR